MTTRLRDISIPAFGSPLALPAIPSSTYEARCDAALAAAGTDWLYVYSDREHMANMAHLCGFDPRFEEAVLLLTKGRRILITGNESMDYTPRAGLDGMELVLCQTLSLMAQWRETAPSLKTVLQDIGLANGDTVGLVGWKYLEPVEAPDGDGGYLLPDSHVRAVTQIVGAEGLSDCTPVLMHPETGQRAVVDADQIALFEWAAARASDAVWRVVTGARAGMSELQIAAHAGYAGEPMAAHMMMSSTTTDGAIIGLASPTGRLVSKGEPVTTAVSYWGGLSSRAGLLTDEVDEDFLDVATCYFDALCAWYSTADIGTEGGAIFDAVSGVLAQKGMKPALNPGHLLSYDEWSHSPVWPDSPHKIRSGMPFQVDVIPVPQKAGRALNNEDAVTFADEALRTEIAEKHPEVWSRITARRAFVAAELGVELPASILPMSNTPLCLPPFWLASNKLVCA